MSKAYAVILKTGEQLRGDYLSNMVDLKGFLELGASPLNVTHMIPEHNVSYIMIEEEMRP
jgi:hypothetical protein